MIGIIDYRIGNIGNVARALKYMGFDHRVIKRPPKDIHNISVLFLPGVGAFKPAMASLEDLGWVDFVRSWTERGNPLLGICLGMQLLFTRSFEEEECSGLGLVEGTVELLPFKKSPHMGWNDVSWSSDIPGVFADHIPSGSFFYFVHSYGIPSSREEMGFSMVDGVRFTSAICSSNIMGFQFHPERSGGNGLKLLQAAMKYFGEECPE
ncbi:MAG: imidazole glycerol phosphate synthase subunit HisH [Synergistales bacterium]|nr:imidazole glycerol phosphate synthase subunit HisH [Synergistales bacterium]